MIFAIAGRRIDASEVADPVFPFANLGLVRERVEELFRMQHASVVVCSAACGADLLVLEVAGSLGVRRRVILPFDRFRFREGSVTDRPGHWGPLFDRILDEVQQQGDLIDLGMEPRDPEAYRKTNHAILSDACSIAALSGDGIAAVLVWNGVSRGDDDMTQAFGATAVSLGLHTLEIHTL